jgi:hypothetical protein
VCVCVCVCVCMCACNLVVHGGCDGVRHLVKLIALLVENIERLVALSKRDFINNRGVAKMIGWWRRDNVMLCYSSI